MLQHVCMYCTRAGDRTRERMLERRAGRPARVGCSFLTHSRRRGPAACVRTHLQGGDASRPPRSFAPVAGPAPSPALHRAARPLCPVGGPLPLVILEDVSEIPTHSTVHRWPTVQGWSRTVRPRVVESTSVWEHGARARPRGDGGPGKRGGQGWSPRISTGQSTSRCVIHHHDGAPCTLRLGDAFSGRPEKQQP